MAGLDVKVSQLGEVVVASDNDLLNLVTYDEQNQTYVSGKVKSSTMKDYMIGDTDISNLGDGTPTGAIDALDGKIDDNYDEWKEQWKKNGAYNILDNKAKTQVITNGGANITVQVQPNKEVWCYGTTSSSSIYLILNNKIPCNEDYRLIGTPPSESPNNVYHVFVNIYNNSDSSLDTTVIDYGQGATVPKNTSKYCIPYITIKENQTIPSGNPIKFKPMMTTDSTATYADYVPYAKTNRELTEVEVGTVTAESGYSFVTGYDNKAYRSINTVYVNLKVTQFTPSSTAWINIATLPTGFIPTNQVVFPVMDDKQGIAVIGRIDNNGKVYVWGTANTAILPFVNTTYIVS